MSELNPGRRIQLTLGGPGDSQFTYRAVLYDALRESEPFKYHYGVFLVPQVLKLLFLLECTSFCEHAILEISWAT